jgi:hypothetical protein
MVASFIKRRPGVVAGFAMLNILRKNE